MLQGLAESLQCRSSTGTAAQVLRSLSTSSVDSMAVHPRSQLHDCARTTRVAVPPTGVLNDEGSGWNVLQCEHLHPDRLDRFGRELVHKYALEEAPGTLAVQGLQMHRSCSPQGQGKAGLVTCQPIGARRPVHMFAYSRYCRPCCTCRTMAKRQGSKQSAQLSELLVMHDHTLALPNHPLQGTPTVVR